MGLATGHAKPAQRHGEQTVKLNLEHGCKNEDALHSLGSWFWYIDLLRQRCEVMSPTPGTALRLQSTSMYEAMELPAPGRLALRGFPVGSAFRESIGSNSGIRKLPEGV